MTMLHATHDAVFENIARPGRLSSVFNPGKLQLIRVEDGAFIRKYGNYGGIR